MDIFLIIMIAALFIAMLIAFSGFLFVVPKQK